MNKQQLVILSKFSGSKSLPICDYAKIDNGELTVTNAESFATIKVNHNGNGCVDLSNLKKVVAKNNIDSISFSEGVCTIMCGNKEFKFASIPTDEFPICKSEFEYETDLEVTDELLRFKKFVGKNELRPFLQGVHWSSSNKEFAATDAHKMIWMDAPKISKDIIIHPDFFNTPKGSYKVYVSSEYTKLESDGITIITKNIEGKFPNYKVIIPTEFNTTMTINKKEFIDLVDDALICTNPVTNRVVLDTSGKLSSEDLDMSSEFTGKFKIWTTEGEDTKIGFNGKFLKDLINECDDEVTLQISAPNRAVIFGGNKLLMPVM